MLASTDVDQALYRMLAGITSGHGLGFNRAALFLHVPRRDGSGHEGIGPYYKRAHRSGGHRLEDRHRVEIEHTRRVTSTRASQRVQSTSLVRRHRSTRSGCVLADACSSSATRLRTDLARWAPQEFVLASIHRMGGARARSRQPLRHPIRAISSNALFVIDGALLDNRVLHTSPSSRDRGSRPLNRRSSMPLRARASPRRIRDAVSAVFDVDRFSRNAPRPRGRDELLRPSCDPERMTRGHDSCPLGGDELVASSESPRAGLTAAARIAGAARQESR